MFEVIKAFSISSGVDIAYEFAPRRAGDVAINYADACLAKEKLNCSAKLGLKAMTDDTWNWQSKYPNGLE
jgi:UDP-glucose 4-epimerase